MPSMRPDDLPSAPPGNALPGPARAFPKRIGILNDYVRIPYANGSSFASQFFYREFTQRGHEVTIVGPHDPVAEAHEMPRRYVELPSVPFKNHPGVRLTLPSSASFEALAAARFDVALGQSNTHLLQAGVWLRHTHDVPFLPVHTVHLPSVYNVVLPDALMKNPVANKVFSDGLIPMLERQSASVYNHSDGLIVLAGGLKRYWEQRGVTVPIHVIPRPIEPKIFDVAQPEDPYPAHFARGGRLIVVCRHTREKNVSRGSSRSSRGTSRARCPKRRSRSSATGPITITSAPRPRRSASRRAATSPARSRSATCPPGTRTATCSSTRRSPRRTGRS